MIERVRTKIVVTEEICFHSLAITLYIWRDQDVCHGTQENLAIPFDIESQ